MKSCGIAAGDRGRVWRWLRPASALAALLLVAGLFIGGAQPVAVGLFAEPWDKVAHALVFGVLGVLLAVTLRGAHWLHGGAPLSLRQTLALAALGALLVGATDEVHQIWLPGRTAAWSDWLADAAGTLLALLGVYRVWRK